MRTSCRRARPHLSGERRDNLLAQRISAFKAEIGRQPRTFIVHGERARLFRHEQPTGPSVFYGIGDQLRREQRDPSARSVSTERRKDSFAEPRLAIWPGDHMLRRYP
jgi:hypothetical protein